MGSGQIASHTYSASGSYTICLIIYDLTTFCVDSACSTITIGSSGLEDFSNTAISMNAYPNPSNSQTTINYTTSTAGVVNIDVFDVLGNKVATIENSNRPAGSHDVKFETKDLTSGVYFVKLSLNGREAMIKLTVTH
jgi:hypothetical protein